MPTKKKSMKKKVPVGAVVAGAAAAAAAAGAAYYFYGSKHAKQHRRKAAKWANDMKKDVVREAKKIQKLDDVVVHEIVDRVAGTYRAAKSVDPKELMQAADELKRNWKRMQSEFEGAKRTVKKTAKKATKAVKRAKKAATKRSR